MSFESPSDDGTYALTINGSLQRIYAQPFDTLADALRFGANTRGNDPRTEVKIGCNAGDCGACTVLMNGDAVCACLVPMVQADGADITLVGGFSDTVATAKLTAAFEAHGAAQCGICTPGMIAAAQALLMTNPAPDRSEIQTAIAGVLCRCTGYSKIVDAVASMSSTQTTPQLDDAGVGARARNRAASHAARGIAHFAADDLCYVTTKVRVIRSPYAHARFTFGDLAAFARHRRLDAVLTSRDVPGANSFGIFPTTKDQPVFADGIVRFRGEAIAALVGSPAQLNAVDDGDVPITWTVLEPIIGVDQAVAVGAPALHAAIPDNVLTRGNLKTGDAAAGHAAGQVTVEGRFETSFVEHAYIEPEAGKAELIDGRMVVTACTQAPVMDQEDVARVLGVPLSDVRIIPTACGGGFGGKLDVSVQPILAVAAHVVKKPVALEYSRTESMVSTTKRHPARIAAKASADATGRLTAYEMHGDFNTGAYASWGPTVANRVPIHAHGPYRVPHVRNTTRAIFTNETPAGAFRGFGVPQAAIAHETLMDDLAARLGLDRWQIRRINALAVGDATASGQLLHASAGLPQCLDVLKPAWHKALDDAATHNANNARYKRGAGVACMWYGCGNTALPNPSSMRITLGRDGRVVVWSGAVDIGQGVSTILEQIVRDTLGLEGAVVRVCDAVGDTDLTLDAGKTSASRQTFVSGNAARLAALELRAKLLRLANVPDDAPLRLLMPGPTSSLRHADGSTAASMAAVELNRARVAHEATTRPALVIGDGDSARQIRLDDLFPADVAHIEAVGRYDPPTTALDADGQGTPYAQYGFAAQIAEVLVDTALGTTKVLHIHAAHDVGRAINPLQVEGQIHGGIAQGLGLALMEEFIPGKTENLHDYLIPTAGDVPPITTHIIEDADPSGPFGAKGVGEPALIATAPAILSAIRHATGVTMRKVPVLPHRLWAALQTKSRP